MGKLARWKVLEKILGEALAAERSRIPADQADQADIVAEYIDYNEFGLAFDHLEYSLDEAGLPFSDAGAAAMTRAADLMGISATGELGRAAR